MKGTIELVELTPELASQLLERRTGQRPVGKVDVAQYAKDIKERRWLPNASDAICVAPDGNLLNGQHRCLAVVEAGVSAPMYIAYGVEPSTFAVMDCGRKRRAADALAIQGHQKNLNVMAAVIRALVLLEKFHDVNKTIRVTTQDSLDFMERNLEDIQSAVSAGVSVRGLSTPVAIAYFHFAKVNRSKADNFVRLLRDEDFGDVEHPGLLLRKKVRTATGSRGVRVDQPTVVAWVYVAFNSFFKNQRIKSIRIASEPLARYTVDIESVAKAELPYPVVGDWQSQAEASPLQ